MSVLAAIQRRVSHGTLMTTLFFGSALITWPILAEYEMFEVFYEYSRDHEELDLDELALLVVNLSAALLVSTLYQSRRLKVMFRKNAEESARAEANARHDPLTGLLNRRALDAYLEELPPPPAPQTARLIAVLDLDRFRLINDLRGHGAGDAALIAVADVLSMVLREDDVIARRGGNEFAIVFGPTTKTFTGERALRRIHHMLQGLSTHGDRSMGLSCSIGLSEWTSLTPASEALDQADRALRLAKTKGAGSLVWFDAEHDEYTTRRAMIEGALNDAIAKSEIEPWFQPIVDLKSGDIVGFEVLARWYHPTLGEVPPTDFVEIAEDSGCIAALGYTLLQEACVVAAGWDPAMTLSFNVSALQFHDPDLVDRISAILQTAKFDPQRLTIEVTESTVISDFDTARDTITSLQGLGISVALDDFGTGYSSLASLRNLPFDRLKIDRCFVTDVENQLQNQKILAGIMALARGLDLEVTAEGIESISDLSFLQALECPLAQGFLFEKAIPSHAVTELLDHRWEKSDFADCATDLPEMKAG